MKAIVLVMCLLAAPLAFAGENIDREDHRDVETALVAAGLNGEEAEKLTGSMVRARFSRQQMHRVGEYIDDMASVPGQPVRMIPSKIHEGIAKNIGSGDILQALERVRNRYRHAYALAEESTLPHQAQMQLGQIYAGCLAAGLQHRHAQQINQALQARTRHMEESTGGKLRLQTMLAAREMVRRGASSEATAGLIDTAMKNGYNAENMVQLRHTFRHCNNGEIEALAARFRHEMALGRPAGVLGRDRNRDGSGPGDGGPGGGGSGGGQSGSGPGDGGPGGGQSGSGPGDGGPGDGGQGGSGPGNGGPGDGGPGGSGPGGGGPGDGSQGGSGPGDGGPGDGGPSGGGPGSGGPGGGR